MKVFYDIVCGELLTEEEAEEKINGELNIYDFIEELQNYDTATIWDMLTTTAKNEIINTCKKHMIEENLVLLWCYHDVKKFRIIQKDSI